MRAPSKTASLHGTDRIGVRLRVVVAPGVGIGPGKIGLLAAIAETGSIAAAGRSLGMSYKRAWHLVTAMNEQFPSPLVEGAKGGRAGGGATLTDLGRDVLTAFTEMQRRCDAAAAPVIEELRRKARMR
jgi:molybdate transport system regulatory protein